MTCGTAVGVGVGTGVAVGRGVGVAVGTAVANGFVGSKSPRELDRPRTGARFLVAGRVILFYGIEFPAALPGRHWLTAGAIMSTAANSAAM
jgi:hypothetical protein